MTDLDSSSATGNGDLETASQSELYDALANDRRRAVLSILTDTPGSMSVQTVARKIAARETNQPGTEVDDELLDEISVMLHHAHLPKLADVGLITYNAATRTVKGPTTTIPSGAL